ncbi:amino acid permease [Neisseriaceae bacterium TC5R-5]|nr:amino acid permease [Neisseriaceae bacterium TC5R-5]
MQQNLAAPAHSGLKVQPLGKLETVGFIVGTNIGAGVLGMAYAARKVGYFPLLICLILTCIICSITMLYIVEASLRTRGNHQLSGLSHRYIGKIGAWLMFIAVAANSYGALTAYMIGSGDILASFFGQYGLSKQLGSILFFIPSILVMYLGLKALGAGQKFISSGMTLIVLVLILATIFHPDTQVARLFMSDWQYVVPIFNLSVFVFGSQYIVPELVRGNADKAAQLPRLIIYGMVATLVLVAAIPASVIALVGSDNLSQVATLSWGKSLGSWAFYSANIFALLAMMTSYWGLGGSLFTNIFDHFHLGDEEHRSKRILMLAVVAIPPFMLAYAEAGSFVNALYFAGTFGGVLMGIIPIILLHKSRKHGDSQPDFVCGWYAHPLVQILIIATFVFSGFYALGSAFNWLPASW